MPEINANGIRITYETFGAPTATPIVLIRGTGTQLVHWPQELIDALVRMGLRAITFDNRDCGRSTNFENCRTPPMSTVFAALAAGEALPSVYRLEDMARDVLGLLDALAIERAHVLGLSLGAFIGQILSAEYANRLHSFVQIMSSAFIPMPHKMHPRVIEAMTASPKGDDQQSFEDHALAVAKASAGSRYPVDEAWFRRTFRLAHARGIWPSGDNRHVLAMMATGDRSAYCRRIRVPTLIVHGTEDPMVPLEEARMTAELIPGAQFVPIEGLGHEFTPEFARTLSPLLETFTKCGRVRAVPPLAP